MHASIVGELGVERHGQRAPFAHGERLAAVADSEHPHARPQVGEAGCADEHGLHRAPATPSNGTAVSNESICRP